MGSIIGNGAVDEKAVDSFFYPAGITLTTMSATELAAICLVGRFRITPTLARVVTELSGLGGRCN